MTFSEACETFGAFIGSTEAEFFALQQSVLAGFEGAEEHLNRAAQLERALGRRWPTGPMAYELVSYLTQLEPLLSAQPANGKRVREQDE